MSEFLPSRGQCPVGRVAQARVSDGIEQLTSAAGIAVGGLRVERGGVVLDQGFWPVGALQSVGIKAVLQIEDERPIARDRFVSFDADVGLAEPIWNENVARTVAVLRDQLLDAVGIDIIEGRAVCLVAGAVVEGSVKGDAVPRQRAFLRARQEIVDKACEAGRRRNRRRRLGWQVCGFSAAEPRHERGGSGERHSKPHHATPRAAGLICERPASSTLSRARRDALRSRPARSAIGSHRAGCRRRRDSW